ncbi:MAG TPA: hypothetical protein VNT75_19045 [Symbiobacteriaceae bacterium]|nr:hypothetical protein [Symbiobacteriaceae bacterium]
MNMVLRCVGTGLLAFLLGPLFGLLLGKAGIIYGTAGMALYLAGRMGATGASTSESAIAGILTVVAPAIAAGLPARWVAETLFYNRYLNGWEQVQVSTFVFLMFMALGAIAGTLGRAVSNLGVRKRPREA